ncbi:MAG: fibronectin type III domain-containing protein [Lachnospiraceae bacterium]|nr:fibronectin type III domain-containing protein [Lachnospiraceae bacterium]
MKKGILGILLCLFMVAAMLPDGIFAAGTVNTVNLTVKEPAAGKKPAATASIPASASTEARKVEWEGDFDADGCFVAGKIYTVHIHVYMKTNMDKVFDKAENINAKINSGERKAFVERVTDTYIIVSGTFAVGGRDAFPKVSNEELKPGDYGTALVGGTLIQANKKMDKNNPDYIFVAKKGAIVQLEAAYILGEGVWPNWHKVSYNGKTGYLLVNNPAKGFTCSLTEFVVEGNHPVEAPKPEVKVKETGIPSVFTFDVTPGQMPHVGLEGFGVGYTMNGCVVESITYSPNVPCEPYTRVTATVVYKAKDGYEFKKDCQSAGPFTKSTERIDEKTIEVTYLTYVGASDTERVTRDMYDYGMALKKAGMLGESFPVLATGTICATGLSETGLDYENYNILLWPTMSKKRTNGKSAVDKGRTLTKKIEIIDLHAERMFSGVVGNWYLVNCANEVGFIPAAYVDNVKLTGYWDGAPGTNKESTYVFAGGSGTPEDPYLIATPEQLDAVRRGLTRSYKLIADIDLSDWGNWIPIGGTPAYGGFNNTESDKGGGVFTGTFDGNGHVISGMTIIDHRDNLYMVSPGVRRFYGLFYRIHDMSDTADFGGLKYGGKVKAEPVIKNLGIVNYTIDISYKNVTDTGNIGATLFVAPFFGMGVGSLENCYSAGGDIKVSCGGSVSVEVGGIGVIGANMYFKDCYNTSSITVTNLGEDYIVISAAGIATQVDYTWFVNCYNTGDITLSPGRNSPRSCASGITSAVYVSDNRGIIGTLPEYSTVIRNCYNAGNLTATGAYGIAGNSPVECYIENCYNVGKLTGDPNPKRCDTAQYISGSSAVWNHGTTYVHDNGVKVVSGDMWKNSKTLGRKVLKSNPEDAIKLPAAKKGIFIYNCEVSDIKKQTYTGEAFTPAVTVTYKGKKLVEGKDYTLGYSKNVEPGDAAVTVSGLGAYKGAVAKTFYITPAKMKGVTGTSNGAKTVTLKWKKDSKGKGYIIEYSLDKKFKEGVEKVTITSKSTTTKRISGLTSGKTYYFRICAYKTEGVGGPYSDVVAVKVK